MVTLEMKTPDEMSTWLPGKKEQYVGERIKAGESAEVAHRMSETQFAELFPDGSPAEGQFVMNVVADGSPIGTLWMGRPFSGDVNTWFIFDLEIAEHAQGRGFGKAAMLAAEDWTREHGGSRVALNVFGPNVIARSLYDSLGYEVQAIAMFKDV